MHKKALLCILMLTLLASCGLHRKTVTPVAMQTDALIERVAQNELQWSWFSAKLTAETDNSALPTLGGRIAMQRDNVIWVSLTAMFGIEAARIMITPDSLLIINRLENTYVQEGYEALSRRFGIGLQFRDLQDALVGNGLWVLGDGEKQHEVEERRYHISNLSGYDGLWVGQDDYLTQRIHCAETYFQLDFDYGNYVDMGSQKMPTSCHLDLKGMYNLAVRVDYTSMTINQEQAFPFKISSKLKRVRI